jgi:ribosomal protein L11 methyltransferase
MDAGASGVELSGGSVIPAEHDEYALAQTGSDIVTVAAYFGEEGFEHTLSSIEAGLEQIEKLSEVEAGTLKISIGLVEDKDWNENFKKHFTTFRAAGRVVIKPSWEDYKPQTDDIVIEIDPGMAFGSGVHETTRMCIELIQKYITQKAAVLDIGCGSGILGIACAKLGAGKVTALDFDSVCVKVTRDNALANGVVIEARQSDLLANAGGGKYGIILAN